MIECKALQELPTVYTVLPVEVVEHGDYRLQSKLNAVAVVCSSAKQQQMKSVCDSWILQQTQSASQLKCISPIVPRHMAVNVGISKPQFPAPDP